MCLSVKMLRILKKFFFFPFIGMQASFVFMGEGKNPVCVCVCLETATIYKISQSTQVTADDFKQSILIHSVQPEGWKPPHPRGSMKYIPCRPTDVPISFRVQVLRCSLACRIRTVVNVTPTPPKLTSSTAYCLSNIEWMCNIGVFGLETWGVKILGSVSQAAI